MDRIYKIATITISTIQTCCLIYLVVIGVSTQNEVKQFRVMQQEQIQEEIVLDDSFMETDYYIQRNLGIVTKEYLFSFHEIVRKPFVIVFVQEGCYYCQLTEQQIQEMLSENTLYTELYFVDIKVNSLRGDKTFEDGDIVDATTFVVNGTPSFLVYDGAKYSTYTGADKFELIIEKLERK